MNNLCFFRWRRCHDVLKKIWVAFLISFGGMALLFSSAHASDWSAMGGDIDNGHHNSFSGIDKTAATQLTELCSIEHTPGAGGDAIGKPTIVDDVIYWTNRGGTMGAHKVIKSNGVATCQELWRVEAAPILYPAYPLPFDIIAQVSPAYYQKSNGDGALLYTAGPGSAGFFSGFANGVSPKVFALDAQTGALLWALDLVTDPTQLAPGGDAFAPSVLSSPRVYDGYAYFGISSLNNVISGINPTVPLTFRGRMFKVDLGINSGVPKISKVTYTLPARPASLAAGERWFAGAGVWSNSPSIIPEKGLVIFGSGQLYDYSKEANDCMNIRKPVKTADFSTELKGETGGGAIACYKKISKGLKAKGIDPVMSSSVIALNISDFSVAWHANTQGLDSWRIDCGLEEEYDCNALPQPLNVPGPDWDVGGNAPVVTHLKGKPVVIAHNKGGSIFWIETQGGSIFRKVDACVGTAFGGTHWGFGFDKDSKTILASCANGGSLQGFGDGWLAALSRAPNGLVTCMTGSLNAIDAETGKLKYQVLPAASQFTYPGDALDALNSCPTEFSREDLRFKYGMKHDIVLKNVVDPSIPVIVMPEPANPTDIPLAGTHLANSNGIAASSQGVAYWPVNYGTVYAIDIATGQYLNQMHCDAGFIYQGASVANGLVSFACGTTVAGPIGAGRNFKVFGLLGNN